MALPAEIFLFSWGTITTFGSGAYLGYHWHERPKREVASPPQQPPPRWHDPNTYKCPVCTHRPREHYSSIEVSHPQTFLGLKIIRMGCSMKGCLCGRQQESLAVAADAWSYEPPSAAALASELLL